MKCVKIEGRPHKFIGNEVKESMLVRERHSKFNIAKPNHCKDPELAAEEYKNFFISVVSFVIREVIRKTF